MAKKPSGAQRRRQIARGIKPRGRGRPLGSLSKSRDELLSEAHRDMAWLGWPTNEPEKWWPGENRRRDLFKYLTDNLTNPDWRESHYLPRECPDAYHKIKSRRVLYEAIAFVHCHRLWGHLKKRSSS